MSNFNEQAFEKKLLALKDSQESISLLSDWCLQNKQHHKKIVNTWLHVLKRVKVENRLTLFYLANDVIQYSKRKNYDFVESWGTALQRATTMVRDDKVKDRIMRIFTIWGSRNVYDEAFLSDLRGLLTIKKTSSSRQQAKSQEETTSVPTSSAFEPSNLFMKIRSCKELEDDTDLKLRIVNDCKVQVNDVEALRKSLKDRRHADNVAGDLDDVIDQMEKYKKALAVEVRERKTVIELLRQAEKFYETERGEAKIVCNAYRNFGNRVKTLKRKLDELLPTLASPVPSPDVNAPSPSPDSDIDLPNDDDLTGKSGFAKRKESLTTRNSSMDMISNDSLPNMDNCFSSFMGSGALPFDIEKNLFREDSSVFSGRDMSNLDRELEGKPIEVIGRRVKEDDSFDITNFLKTLAHGPPAKASGIPGLGDPLPVPPPTLPPASAPTPAYAPQVPPPPLPPMFDGKYSSPREARSRNREDSWNTTLPPKFPTWGDAAAGEANWEHDEAGDWLPVLPVSKVPPPPLPIGLETPESPPNFEKESFREPVEYDDTVLGRNARLSGSDVDHRVALFRQTPLKDTDHRIPNNRFKKDVDHRNLISLTGSPHDTGGEIGRAAPVPLPPPGAGGGVWAGADQDYRSIPMPPRPCNRPPRPRQAGDNVESVDMEMSMSDDDEVDGKRAKSAEPKETNAKTRPKDIPPPLGPPPAMPMGSPPPGMSLRFPAPLMPAPLMSLAPMSFPPRPYLETPPPIVHSQNPLALSAPPLPLALLQNTPASASSGPDESDNDSINQYLNIGLSEDEEIKDFVASVDPQIIEEVVEASTRNGAQESDGNNGDLESCDSEWNPGESLDGASPRGRRSWKSRSHSTPTPNTNGPSTSPSPRFRGQSPNWARGRGWGFRSFRGGPGPGRGVGGARPPFNW